MYNYSYEELFDTFCRNVDALSEVYENELVTWTLRYDTTWLGFELTLHAGGHDYEFESKDVYQLLETLNTIVEGMLDESTVAEEIA